MLVSKMQAKAFFHLHNQTVQRYLGVAHVAILYRDTDWI